MSSSGYLVPPSKNPAHEKLWTQTWNRLKDFLPGLYGELFPEEQRKEEERRKNEEAERKEAKDEKESKADADTTISEADSRTSMQSSQPSVDNSRN